MGNQPPLNKIADLLQTKEDKITVSIVNVHMQVGAADCGLFAIAFVIAVIHGHNPTKCYFSDVVLATAGSKQLL